MDINTQNTPVSPVDADVQGQKRDTSLPPLPRAIYDYFGSPAYFDTLYALEEAFSIPPEKVGAIPFIIGAIVKGELDPKDVPEAIQVALGKSKEDALRIAEVIKDKILNPIAGGLLIAAGIDIEPIPGPSAKNAKDLPALAQELEPYLASLDKSEKPKTVPAGAKSTSDLEPLVAGPKNQAAAPAGVGMTTPGLRVMKDVRAPAAIVAEKKPEPAQPETISKLVAGQRPFMLHEEKPAATMESAAVRVDKNFSFDAGQNPAQKQAPRPATAQFGSSFDDALSPNKSIAPQPSKPAPAEEPKVIHYTAFKTVLDENGNPKKS